MDHADESSQDLGSFLWTPEEAEMKEITQIGTSACGATAVLNVLVCDMFNMSAD